MGLAERLNSVSPPSARNIPTPSGKRSSIARDEYAMLKHDVHEQLLQALGQQAYAGQMEQRVLEENVFNAIQSVLAKSKKPLSTVDRARISQEIIDDILDITRNSLEALGYWPLPAERPVAPAAVAEKPAAVCSK